MLVKSVLAAGNRLRMVKLWNAQGRLNPEISFIRVGTGLSRGNALRKLGLCSKPKYWAGDLGARKILARQDIGQAIRV